MSALLSLMGSNERMPGFGCMLCRPCRSPAAVLRALSIALPSYPPLSLLKQCCSASPVQASVVLQPSVQRMAPQPVQSWPAPLQAGTEAGPGSLQEVCAAMHMQLLASQRSASHQAMVSGSQTVERTALLLTVQLQDLAIKEAFKLMTQGQCLTVQDSTQQHTGGVQTASQAQLGASAALQQPCAAPVAAEAPSSYQELAASAAKQQQALVQLILLELAAGAVVPASLIQELGVVAAIQQEAADAHIRQLAGGARVQQEAAAVLVAKMKAEHRQAAAEQRQAAADQDQLLLDLAQAKSERAQANGLLASAQSERDELRRELNDVLAVPLVRPEVRGDAIAVLMVPWGGTVPEHFVKAAPARHRLLCVLRSVLIQTSTSNWHALLNAAGQCRHSCAAVQRCCKPAGGCFHEVEQHAPLKTPLQTPVAGAAARRIHCETAGRRHQRLDLEVLG